MTTDDKTKKSIREAADIMAIITALVMIYLGVVMATKGQKNQKIFGVFAVVVALASGVLGAVDLSYVLGDDDDKKK